MKFKIKPFFVAIGVTIMAIATFLLQKLFSTDPRGNVNKPSDSVEDSVSEESYVHPDISKEEEATDYQTQKIDSVIKDGAEKVEVAKKDTNIKSTQEKIDSNWDNL